MNTKQYAVVEQIKPLLDGATWFIRVVNSKKHSGPVLAICEKYVEDGKTKTQVYGRIYNGDLRACKRAIQYMLSQVNDNMGRSLGLQLLVDDKVEYRGNIPLDNIIGTKMALLFKLHPQIRNESRIELLAWRIERFTYEESMYWLSKVSIPTYGKRSMEWAKSGLRLMLSGKSEDQKSIDELLEQLRK